MAELTPKERAHYDAIFTSADVDKDDKLNTSEVGFLRTSRLPGKKREGGGREGGRGGEMGREGERRGEKRGEGGRALMLVKMTS